MERERRRWRIRISTLMLLVVIAALAAALIVERRRCMALEQQALAEASKTRQQALTMVRRALAQAELARLQAELNQESGRVRRPILRYHLDDGANR